jgi:spermidine/putrescine ABC transporter ATP-binding subunit
MIREETPPAVELRSLSKRFGAEPAVEGVSLTIAHGEFFSLLGPSGCGKTTTLRMIGGFEAPSEGSVLLAGEDITTKPPHLRQIGMVFQNYALFPHLTVFDNIAFPLRLRRTPPAEIAERVGAALAMVRLPGLEARRPEQISGGQQQRVAVARALVFRPAVVLLDEPLGALDQKLRKAMQLELKALQRDVGLTFVYVTHDQEEALTMSDRIAVMHQGRVLQVADPRTLYEQPASRFVADFIGVSNLLPGTVCALTADRVDIALAGTGVIQAPRRAGLALGQEVTVAVRPERLSLEAGGSGSDEAPHANRLYGTVRDVIFTGGDTQVFVALAGGDVVVVRLPNDVPRARPPAAPGRSVRLIWDPESTAVLVA